MQKMMQTLVTRNIKDEIFGRAPYIYNNVPTNQVGPQDHNAACDYIYTGRIGKRKLHFRFPKH